MRRMMLPVALSMLVCFVVPHGQRVEAASSGPMVLNVEVDYFVGADHSHVFTGDQIDYLVGLFACEEITLNIAIDDTVQELANPCTPCGSGGDGRKWDSLVTIYRDHAPESGWIHVMLIHGFCDLCTRAHADGVPGTRFIQPDNDGDYAGLLTFAHEFGHVLGLSGDKSRTGVNYPSIVSYTYSTSNSGVARSLGCWGLNSNGINFKLVDYSHGTLPDINEAALNESVGIGLGPVDFNCNGVIDPGVLTTAYNLEGAWACRSQEDPNPHVLKDFDDWAVIRARASQSLQAGVHVGDPVDCNWDSRMRATISDQLEFAPGPCFYYPSVFVDIFGYYYTDLIPEPCTEVHRDYDGDGRSDYSDVCPTDSANTCCCRVPGDVNDNGARELTDLDGLIDYVFQGGGAPPCQEQADLDDSGFVDALDLAVMIDCFYYSSCQARCGSA